MAMKSRFDDCFDFLMKWEGESFENDPQDPGGATKFGIDQRSHPNIHIRDLTRDQAKAIYRKGEWTRLACDQMPAGVDLALFDTGVNIGTGRAALMWQKALGVKADSFIGPKTIAASAENPAPALRKFYLARINYYKSLPARLQKRFLGGWLNRVADARAETMDAIA
jgi:lysozyme family protein